MSHRLTRNPRTTQLVEYESQERVLLNPWSYFPVGLLRGLFLLEEGVELTVVNSHLEMGTGSLWPLDRSPSSLLPLKSIHKVEDDPD